MSDEDPFLEYRGRVDDRLLDDERLPWAFRVELAGAITDGQITLGEAAAEIQAFLSSQEEPSEAEMSDGPVGTEGSSSGEADHEPQLDEQPLTESQAALTPSEGDSPMPPVEIVTPEELKGLHLTTAAALMPPEEEELPPLPSEASPPIEGDVHGAFVIQKRPGYGDGFRELIRVEESGETTYLAVGIWLDQTYPKLPGDQVLKLLTELGLPEPRAQKFAAARQRRLDGEEAVASFPAIERLAAREREHLETKDSFSRAFVEAQKKKERKR